MILKTKDSKTAKTRRTQSTLTKLDPLRLVSFIVLILLSQTVFGEIKLPSIISNNMVLEQRSIVPLWGNATANHKVSVTTSWNNQHYTTQSDADGKWKIEIQTPKAGGPYSITFDDGDELTITDVLVGEVWVCSGQSNMEISMKGYTNTPILNSNDILMHANDPQLRLFHLQRAVSNIPLEDCKGSWKLSNAESGESFSAVGFQFAKKMQKILKVPVGIIEAAWGGTPIKGWMDKKSLQLFPQLKIPSENTKASSQQPACLFNGMINPIVGYGIKGFIWYQGESDRRDSYIYKDLMVAMIKEWRALWGRGQLPFYYVQIAPYEYSGKLKDSVPYVREAQARAMKALPHVGMAVSMDVGNKNTIHPPDKTTIARRLLYWALGDAYHWDGITYESPSFQSMEIKDNMVTVSFDHASHGLTSFDQKINGFELAGKDKVFYPAEAKIKGRGKVVLQSDQVLHPVAVRYLFKDWVESNLYNTEGLPAGPFRTDNW